MTRSRVAAVWLLAITLGACSGEKPPAPTGDEAIPRATTTFTELPPETTTVIREPTTTTTTEAPPPPPTQPAPPPTAARRNCDPSYPDVCIPPPPPDLDCGDISYRRFRVTGSDPHGFDRDGDGIGCESG